MTIIRGDRDMAEAGSDWRCLAVAVLAVVLPLTGLLLLIFNGRGETPDRVVPTVTTITPTDLDLRK